MLATVTERDFEVAAIVIVIVALLVYRILRGEPGSRIVRLGVFIERRWNGKEKKIYDHDKPALPPSTHTVDPDDKETQVEWPQRDKEI